MFNFASLKLPNVNTMDIVNRLKFFMEKHGIGSTQFADACGIPRPTLSQILSGRNKKISDEVISKIHNAYPSLSVLWLLFGEGVPEVSANIEISEPLNGTQTSAAPASANAFYTPGNPTAEKPNEEIGGLFGPDMSPDPLMFDDDKPMREISSPKQAESPTVTIPADGTKSIVNIMVFYSDNSFQSFIPR